MTSHWEYSPLCNFLPTRPSYGQDINSAKPPHGKLPQTEVFNWPEPWLWGGSPGLGQALLYKPESQDLAHLPDCSVPPSPQSSGGQQAGSSHLQGSFLHRTPGSSFKDPHTMSHLVKTQACFYNLYHTSKTQNKFNSAYIPSVKLRREN